MLNKEGVSHPKQLSALAKAKLVNDEDAFIWPNEDSPPIGIYEHLWGARTFKPRHGTNSWGQEWTRFMSSFKDIEDQDSDFQDMMNDPLTARHFGKIETAYAQHWKTGVPSGPRTVMGISAAAAQLPMQGPPGYQQPSTLGRVATAGPAQVHKALTKAKWDKLLKPSRKKR